MVEQVLSMLETARKALVDEDMELANTLFAKDNIVDEINGNVSKILADYIHEKPEEAEFCLNFKSVFLKLERTGDHTTNLDEEIIFYIDAKVLKHSYLNPKGNKTKL